jgi:hypothetical protein
MTARTWDDLELLLILTEGITACGQVPEDELKRISCLADRDYYLALHAYHLAVIFARRQEAQRAAA